MSRRRRSRKKSNIDVLIKFFALIFTLFFTVIVSIISWLVRVIPQIIYFIWSICGYSKSEYFKVTHTPLFKLIFDKGAYGEYLIYRHLDKKITGEHKWLFNTYIPRGETRTTEIDVMLIHSSGIFVFESKNYKGWIFGTESRRVWTQCIKSSENSRAKKYHFLNPIMQNKLHLTCLNDFFSDEQKQLPIYSIVVFGNRCHLKKINLTSGKHNVVLLKQLSSLVPSMILHNNSDNNSTISNSIYSVLYPLTQVSEEIKQKHIADIMAEINQSTNETHNHSNTDANIEISTPEVTNVSPTHTTSNNHTTSNDICPRCGATLVKRTVQKGERAGQTFWGCSNYPRCRYTKS